MASTSSALTLSTLTHRSGDVLPVMNFSFIASHSSHLSAYGSKSSGSSSGNSSLIYIVVSLLGLWVNGFDSQLRQPTQHTRDRLIFHARRVNSRRRRREHDVLDVHSNSRNCSITMSCWLLHSMLSLLTTKEPHCDLLSLL
jgi:hypothetical protein